MNMGPKLGYHFWFSPNLATHMEVYLAAESKGGGVKKWPFSIMA